MVIVSKQNPIVKELSSLKEKKGRKARGTFLVEGEKMLSECEECGMEVVRVAILTADGRISRLQSPEFQKANSSKEMLFLGEDAFRAISDEKTPQGILAEVKIPSYPVEPPKGNCIFLDGVADPANVGAIVRTAAAAGYEEIYLADCADPFSPKCVRASMSGVFRTKLMRGTREELLSVLEGTPLIAADMDGENVFSFVPPERFCLCIGNEGNGLSEETKRRAAHTVSIPMEGGVESLNAAVSAGILMYELKK